MSQATKNASLGEVPDALMNLIRAQVKLGQDLVESLTGMTVPSVGDQVRKLQAGQLRPSCHIPPPCWMPRPLGECVSHVSPCKTACIRLRITNCDRRPRTLVVTPQGHEKHIKVTPASVTIRPMERATVEVCLVVPDDAERGDQYESILWVQGCQLQYLRWTVSVGTAGIDSCHEVEVKDCPDYLHHWYDHFYCVRPCPREGRKLGDVAGTASRG